MDRQEQLSGRHQVQGMNTKSSSRAHRLSDALGVPCRGAFRSVKTLSYNASAIKACEDFAVGRDYLVALVGPSGWGKSLLLHSVADWMSKEYQQEIKVHNTLDWLKSPPRSDSLLPFILDDLQEAIRRPKARHQVKTILERRVKLRRPTLVSLTAWDGESSPWSPVLKEREWTLCYVNEPSTEDKKVIIRQMAEFDNVKLSDELVSLMARFIDGNGCSMNGALRCLSLMKSDWSGREDVCRACGILMPFFVLHEGWDPREEVLEAVQRTSDRHPACSHHSEMVACHLMLSMTNLGEEIVARYMRMTPAEVYTKNNQAMAIGSDSPCGLYVERCRQEVIRAFSRF